ncbi:MAG: ATP-dependent DNA ligase [Actinomycetota bacterium]
MLFRSIADVSEVVAATSKRGEKTAAIAAVIADLEPHEVEAAIGFLSGTLRQGRIGTGWRGVRSVHAEPIPKPELHIADVDEAFSAIQDTTGSGSVARRGEILTALLGRATDSEADLIRALLTGGVRQGALAGVVTDAAAKAAGVKPALLRRAAMLSGDLGFAARIALAEGADGLADVELQVGTGVQPMLASTAEDLDGAAAELGLVSIEWKLDGARIQVHRDGPHVRIFTRNLNDITDRLPEVVEVALSLDVASIVLDGETLALDDQDRPRAFQDTMSRFGRDEDSGWHTTLQPRFFDILHLDGEQLIDRPLVERRERLVAVAPDHAVPGTVTDDLEIARSVEAEALSLGHEGVMVKAADSVYEAGRRGKSWRKVKPVHTLDLVVLAAEWGHGRRTGWLSNLHLGARGVDSSEFVMVGKTFKGLTDELLEWQTSELLQRELRREGITVFVRPELVVEIAVDGVQTSTRYAGGAALRFARVKTYREDKAPGDADTIDTVRSMMR